MNKKVAEIVKFSIYIFLPITIIILYSYLLRYYYLNEQDGITCLTVVYILQAISMCYIANVSFESSKKIHLVITVLYTLMFSLVLLGNFTAIGSALLGTLVSRVAFSVDVLYLWFGTYLFCLIKIIFNIFHKK